MSLLLAVEVPEQNKVKYRPVNENEKDRVSMSEPLM